MVGPNIKTISGEGEKEEKYEEILDRESTVTAR